MRSITKIRNLKCVKMPLKEVIAKKTRKHALSWHENKKDVFWSEFYLEAFATIDKVAVLNQYEICDFCYTDEWPTLFFILEPWSSSSACSVTMYIT
jgi:hypothetical protein